MENDFLEPGAFYQHGWQSWNVAAWRPRGAPVRYPQVAAHRRQSTDPAHLDDTVPGGSGLGALALENGDIRLLGALELDSWVTCVDEQLSGQGGERWFDAQGNEAEVFAAYAQALQQALGARASKPGRVWCSWYSFYRQVSQVGLQQVLAGLEDLPFDVVQIDDGWQRANGDWQANARFPDGMDALAERIKGTGRQAGIWLAPFIVDPASTLYQQYPQMLLRDKAGDPVVAAENWGPSYTLDVTRADVRDWLSELIAKVVAQGYSYLKLDFLYAAALPGCYQHESGREQAYREASMVIREAAGDDVYLLACGAPVMASIGVYDGLRVGPDVAEQWDNVDRTLHLADRAGPGAADAITTTLGRYWLKPLINIDPDVTYFRSHFCMLSGEQKKMLADLAEVCEFKANSDLPAWLMPDEKQRLQDFLLRQPVVKQLGPYRFSIDNNIRDFGEVVRSRPW